VVDDTGVVGDEQVRDAELLLEVEAMAAK